MFCGLLKSRYLTTCELKAFASIFGYHKEEAKIQKSLCNFRTVFHLKNYFSESGISLAQVLGIMFPGVRTNSFQSSYALVSLEVVGDGQNVC